MGEAIIELGDRALAEQANEGAIAAGALGDFNAEQRLGPLADFGALGNVAQAVEIDIGA